MSKKLTTEVFIEQSKTVHGDVYDYSESKYKGAHKKVKIICFIHGAFFQSASSHKSGIGCPYCGKENFIKKRTYSTEEFIKKAQEIYGNEYDLSKVKYTKAKESVEIICHKHGSFFQTPNNFLRGYGCSKCNNKKTAFNLLVFYKNNPEGLELGHNYLIRLFYGSESFLKRGITRRTIKKRFINQTGIYDYEIIEDNIMTNYECAQKEAEDEIKYKQLKYTPKDTSWGGFTECYKEFLNG